MKFVQRLVLFVFINILCISHGFCEELGRTDSRLGGEKIYIQPDQIHIESDGIFVKLSDRWFIAEAVFLDAGGVYVNKVSDVVSFFWTCRNCGYEKNSCFRNTCKICKFRPTSDN